MHDIVIGVQVIALYLNKCQFTCSLAVVTHTVDYL